MQLPSSVVDETGVSIANEMLFIVEDDVVASSNAHEDTGCPGHVMLCSDAEYIADETNWMSKTSALRKHGRAAVRGHAHLIRSMNS